MLNVKNINVDYGRRRILHDVSFAAQPGEVTCVIGPNGSGKSTLLKAISGLNPYKGSITLNGQELSSIAADRLAGMRGVLPQSSNLSFPLTVFEIVRLGALSGLQGDPQRMNSTIDEALSGLGLAGFGPRLYQELSGGEQQRVQLARVLCQIGTATRKGQPNFLLLDEPTSSLDMRHQLTVMNAARNFAARGGSVIAIMHDLNLAASYADHMVLIENGRVVSEGPPASVLNEPDLRRVYDVPLEVMRTDNSVRIYL